MKIKKFSRKKKHREMMLRNLSTSLILFEKISTTLPKAKQVKCIVDNKISVAKKKSLSARRKLLAYFLDKNAVKKIFEELVPRYSQRETGFVRIYHLGTRLGDGSQQSLIELVPDTSTTDLKKESHHDQQITKEIKNEKKKKTF